MKKLQRAASGNLVDLLHLVLQRTVIAFGLGDRRLEIGILDRIVLHLFLVLFRDVPYWWLIHLRLLDFEL